MRSDKQPEAPNRPPPPDLFFTDPVRWLDSIYATFANERMQEGCSLEFFAGMAHMHLKLRGKINRTMAAARKARGLEPIPEETPEPGNRA